ncbi:hypothetical protein [Ligilactobacillus salivarius]|nr:hypothetical protein [Ligilactobacillus salivarius]
MYCLLDSSFHSTSCLNVLKLSLNVLKLLECTGLMWMYSSFHLRNLS